MSELETLLANMAVGDVTHVPGLTVRCVPGGWIYTIMPEIGTAVGSSSAFVPRPENYSRTNKYKPDEPKKCGQGEPPGCCPWCQRPMKRTHEPCRWCNGDGEVASLTPDCDVQTCPKCKGTGEETEPVDASTEAVGKPEVSRGDYVEVTIDGDGKSISVYGIMQTDVNLCTGLAEVYTLNGIVKAHHSRIKKPYK